MLKYISYYISYKPDLPCGLSQGDSVIMYRYGFMGILEEIVNKKRQRLSEKKFSLPLKELKAKAVDMPLPNDFARAIKRETSEGLKLIAEIKRASPSEGLIREDFRPLEIARIYEEYGASAISVLTEEDYFQGSLEYLKGVRTVVKIPLLRKDFIFHEYEVYESRVSGADAILLIDAILSKTQAQELFELARELGLSVLYEIHHYSELEHALELDVPIIGINNRNLKTLKIDLNTTRELIKDIPEGKIVISESGINTRDDLKFIESLSVDAVLIGTTLMKAEKVGEKIKELFF